jgi:hypothetical protein
MRPIALQQRTDVSHPQPLRPFVVAFFAALALVEPLGWYVASCFQCASHFHSDFVNYSLPALGAAARAIAARELPFLDLNQGFGVPNLFAGSKPFVELPLLAAMSLPNFVVLQIAVWTFVALCVFQRLAARLTATEPAAALAAIFFVFSGYALTYRLDMFMLPQAACMAGIAVLCARAGEGRSFARSTLAAACLAALIFSYGRPTDAVYSLAGAGVLATLLRMRKQGFSQAFASAILFAGLCVALGVVLAAPFLLDHVDFLKASNRFHPELVVVQATNYLRFQDLVEIAVPGLSRLLGAEIPGLGALSWRWNLAGPSAAIGYGAVSLALIGALTSGRLGSIVVLLSALTLIFVLPTGAFEILRALPGFAGQVEVVRLLPIFTALMALLAGLGLDTTLRGDPRGLALLRICVWIGALGAIALGILWFLGRTPYSKATMLTTVALSTGGLAALLYAARGVRGRAAALAAGIVLMAIGRLASFAFPGDIDGDNLAFQARNELLTEEAGDLAAALRSQLRPGFDRVVFERRAERQWAARNGLAQIGYYLPAVPSNLALFARHAIGADQSFFLHYAGGDATLDGAMNVHLRVLVAPSGGHSVEPIGEFVPGDASQTGFFAASYGIELDRVAALRAYVARLKAERTASRFVTINRQPDGIVNPLPPIDARASLAPVAAENSRIVYRVATDDARLAVLSFRYDKNWRFEMAGQSVETVEVDGFWLGVIVPPGEGTLVGRYTPRFAAVVMDFLYNIYK